MGPPVQRDGRVCPCADVPHGDSVQHPSSPRLAESEVVAAGVRRRRCLGGSQLHSGGVEALGLDISNKLSG